MSEKTLDKIVNRVIQIDTPSVTPREYARRTGLSEGAVRGMIKDGRIPVIKHVKPGQEGKSCAIMVNLMLIAQDALNQEVYRVYKRQLEY